MLLLRYEYPVPLPRRDPRSKYGRIQAACIEEMERLGWKAYDLTVIGRVTNVRFVLYRLIDRRVLPKQYGDGKKGKQPQQEVSRVLADLRLAGVFPLESVVDETSHGIEHEATFDSILEGAQYAASEFLLDPWTGNAPIPFLISESSALYGTTIRPLKEEFRVPAMALGGQASIPDVLEAAKNLRSHHHVVYCGDWDRSGGDIEVSARNRIFDLQRTYLGLESQRPEWERLLLTEEQVEFHNLTVISRYDKRTKMSHPAVEAEALDQLIIEQMIRDRLTEFLKLHGHDNLDHLKAEEKRQRNEVLKRLK